MSVLSVLMGVVGSFVAIIAFSVLWRHPKISLADRCGRSNRRRCLSALYTHRVGCGAGFFFCAGDCVYGTSFAIFKAPVTVFLIAGILPTVPGAGMYRIAYSIVANDRAGCAYYLLQTLEIAGMIALAIFIVDAIFRVHIPLSRRNS